MLFLNNAFARVAGLKAGDKPSYPGDLVVREDQAAVADAVRRFAVGPQMSGDIAVRMRDQPDEPIALSLAGVRGLGEAAVLLSLKDNSEERASSSGRWRRRPRCRRSASLRAGWPMISTIS